MKACLTGLLAAIFISGCSGCGAGSAEDDDLAVNTGLSTTTVLVHASGGDFSVTAEVADTDTTHAIGLMNRQELAADAGMLFVFAEDNTYGFWMKNTYISLDILFIDVNREIIHIAESTTPLSTELIAPATAYRYVLEINAGQAATSGLQVGDAVEFAL